MLQLKRTALAVLVEIVGVVRDVRHEGIG